MTHSPPKDNTEARRKNPNSRPASPSSPWISGPLTPSPKAPGSNTPALPPTSGLYSFGKTTSGWNFTLAEASQSQSGLVPRITLRTPSRGNIYETEEPAEIDSSHLVPPGTRVRKSSKARKLPPGGGPPAERDEEQILPIGALRRRRSSMLRGGADTPVEAGREETKK
ncbi:hypothetical protein BDN72DRAFT_899200 [Pluteus cervinus]|uniref:Uncharacterized protein n=1 Tax=Pluteus cervinus TaxID=181527 RepID=A0ACD3ANA1_9AGAR|nr:hypothetical protein BDN72DRAFT_899200 [Pluteus cervinus]